MSARGGDGASQPFVIAGTPIGDLPDDDLARILIVFLTELKRRTLRHADKDEMKSAAFVIMDCV